MERFICWLFGVAVIGHLVGMGIMYWVKILVDIT